MSERTVNVGDPVVYHDNRGVPHHALVTAVWSQLPIGTINVVYVESDTNATDQYGRQIDRSTSLCHRDYVEAHGNYWRFADEEPTAYRQPEQR